MNKVVPHNTGHRDPCLEYQYWGSKARGSGVQSHPQLCGEFEASLSYIKLSKNQNLSTIYLAHTRLCSLLINSLIFRKCPITRSLKFNKAMTWAQVAQRKAGIQAQSFNHRHIPASAAVLLSEPTAPMTTGSCSPSVCRSLLVFTGKKTIMWQRRELTRSESHRLLFIHGICKFHQNTILPLGGH